ALRSSRLGLALVEELVEEPVVTVSAFSRDGVFHPLAVTDRAPLAHVWESCHAQAATVMAARATRALGIRDGPTATQLLAGGGRPAEALERATQAAECIRFRPPHAQAV